MISGKFCQCNNITQYDNILAIFWYSDIKGINNILDDRVSFLINADPVVLNLGEIHRSYDTEHLDSYNGSVISFNKCIYESNYLPTMMANMISAMTPMMIIIYKQESRAGVKN